MGMLEPGEACDDGNTVNTDICTNRCESNLSYLNGETPVHRHFVMGGQDPIGANDMGVLSPVYGHDNFDWSLLEQPGTPYLLNPYFILRNEVTLRKVGWRFKNPHLFFVSSSPQLELRNDLSQHPRRPMTEVTLTEARAYRVVGSVAIFPMKLNGSLQREVMVDPIPIRGATNH